VAVSWLPGILLDLRSSFSLKNTFKLISNPLKQISNPKMRKINRTLSINYLFNVKNSNLNGFLLISFDDINSYDSFFIK